VSDDGSGMTPEKKQQLLTDKETLDGELHSLGFVFVRQTVEEYEGELSIDSELGKGTTITIHFPFLPGKTVTRTGPSGREEYGLISRPEEVRAEPEATPVTASASSGTAATDGAERDAGPEEGVQYGKVVLEDYQASRAQFPGSIFAIAVTPGGEVDCFTHKPYERHWNITHEDLSPMLYQSTIRGRLEEDDQKRPVLILKPPQSVAEYFDLKELPQRERSAESHLQMVHDEYIRVARTLIETGMPAETGVLLADAQRYFQDQAELQSDDPFPLQRLAEQELVSEAER
jgi:hypothetical protein